MRDAGATYSKIADRFKCHPDTARYTVKQASKRNNHESLPRPGRPDVYTPRDQRALGRIVREDPAVTFLQARVRSGKKISRDALKKSLNAVGLTHHVAAIAPDMKKCHYPARLAWALKHVDWTEEQWKNVIFSDETGIFKGYDTYRRYRWYGKGQKYAPKMTRRKGRHAQGRQVMIWACFSGKGQSPLFFLRNSFDKEKNTRGGHDSGSMIECFEEMLPQVYEPGMFLLQDGASIHKSKETTEFLENLCVLIMDWPAFSPDLNPIENAWNELKRRLIDQFPDLMASTSRSQAHVAAVKAACEKVWSEIEPEYFNTLIRSMKKRCEAVIAAKGGPTKY